MSRSDIDDLIRLFAKLPGLGPRSARRLVLQLLRHKDAMMLPLADALTRAAGSIRSCSSCGNLDTHDPCAICSDTRRDPSTICVVEDLADLWAIERCNLYRGLYHVLGGTLSAIDDRGPSQLNIEPLVVRAQRGEVKELILATNATIEGQTTAHYITTRLAGLPVSISRLAQGIPMGGELDYLDDGTLGTALKARLPFDMHIEPVNIPLSTALRESISGGYRREDFRHDLMAALVVSLVALPLAMALSIAVGLPPQYGIYTAIVAGIVTPLLGGSVMQVSGPTAAFVVILAPIVAEHGLRGIIIAEILAGLLLLMLAWARLGRFVSFVPYPVTTGFTAGIAVVLGVLSLNDLLGLGVASPDGSFVHKVSVLLAHLPDARWPEMLIGLLSLAVMFSGKRITSRIPSSILGVLVGTAVGLALQHFGYAYASIGSRFSYEIAGGVRGQGIPPFIPMPTALPDGLTFLEIKTLFMPAVVIAALAALESLLSASVADGLSRTRHHPNGELAAIGIANIATGLFGGIPATGAIARTTTNIKSGARTPLASAMHGLLILLYVMALAPLLSYIPMAALAALLLLVAYNMSHYRQFFRILRIAPRHDVIVLLSCFGLTVFVDMVAGVTVGIILAALLFTRTIADITEVQIENPTELPDSPLPPNVLVCHISGPLFFATVERLIDRTAFLRNRIDTLILDMEHVPLIDMTGLVAIKNLLTNEALSGKRVVLCAKEDITTRIVNKLAAERIELMVMPTVQQALDSLAKTKAV